MSNYRTAPKRYALRRVTTHIATLSSLLLKSALLGLMAGSSPIEYLKHISGT